MGAMLLPLLIQVAPVLLDLIAKNQGPIKDFLGKLDVMHLFGQTGPGTAPAGTPDLGALFKALGGPGTDWKSLEAPLTRIATALEAIAEQGGWKHPSPGA